MKRVLVITYYWPPSGGSGVQRWVKFAKFFPSFGWQPVIYTPSNPSMPAVDRTLGEEVPSEAEVIKHAIHEPYGIYRKIMRKGSSSDAEALKEVEPIRGGRMSFKHKLSLFIRGNFFIPDPRCWWIGPSVRFLKKYLDEHPVDVIVSTGPPHSMHMIARGLSKKTGVPWIADFRDAWTRMYFYKYLALTGWADRRHHRMEKAVLDDAAAVVSVSPREQKEFQTMTDNHIFLITNGFDADDYAEPFYADDNFNVVSTGLFTADGNSEALWRVLAAKCEADGEFRAALRIRLVGKIDQEIVRTILDAGLEKNLMNFGYKDHRIAVKEQRNASMLILPLRREPEYASALPGKLFEYLASRRPVIGIGQPDSAMADIVKESRAGRVFDWEDGTSIKGYVDECWERFKAGSLDDNDCDISRFDRKTLAGEYVKLMESLL